MGCDELVAFFRCQVFVFDGPPNPPGDGEQKRAAAEKPASAVGIVTPAVEDCADEIPNAKNVSSLIRKWLDDPKKKVKLVATLTAFNAGQLIGRKESTVRGAGKEWDELQAEFETYKAYLRLEKQKTADRHRRKRRNR